MTKEQAVTHLTATPALVVAFAIMAVTGLLLMRSAPSYGSLLINLHKVGVLLLIAAVVLRARAAHLDTGLPGTTWAVLVVVAVAVVLAVATGGLLSALSSPPAAVLVAHRILPFAVLATTVVAAVLVPAPVR
ncbi:hypothetical protein OEB99_03190 [Actinotalea sp. M2MS4P-6]|uniref:hypothetical protein n=1 Tax=Actinotalea sp. M2MS4P-6 TaxID=2983762 RepID=UPI0021E40CAF|nr:hypothetical protein [Actinotalea sp. M2MS4P-6]MCV2393303.1 hypothetical protein [Actinotalea sp. M2MS4P-6]